MKIGVVQFPGSNCDRETKLALQRIGHEPVDCFWHADAAFVESLDGFVIVGGFSYEDRVRSGLIASKDPFMRLLAAEAEQGKPILGICNGAQILVESGLVPPMALAVNKRVSDGQLIGTGFYNEWVYVKSNHAPTNTPVRIPVAHGEGRFLLDPATYEALQGTDATLYYYCDADGLVNADFPINPNGSMYNLAAVSNAAGNVMAMMPHPERTPAGDLILKSFFTIPQSLRDSSLIKGALAPHTDTERFYARLETVLRRVDFLKPGHDKIIMQKLRRLFQRTQLETNEVIILLGILSNIEWNLKHE